MCAVLPVSLPQQSARADHVPRDIAGGRVGPAPPRPGDVRRPARPHLARYGGPARGAGGGALARRDLDARDAYEAFVAVEADDDGGAAGEAFYPQPVLMEEQAANAAEESAEQAAGGGRGR